jgi:hypothetical protein
MKVYPFPRDDAVLDGVAIRLAGGDAPWNPRADRLELAPPENGEPIHMEVRLDVDVPTVLGRPLLPSGHPVTLLAVARCRDTRWAEVVQTWTVPLRVRKRFTPDPAIVRIDGEKVAGQFRLVFCLCLAEGRDTRPDSLARKRWNILAEKRFTVVLSGSGGSITEWVSFSQRGLPAGLWHLHVPAGDLEERVGDLRLYLNADVESFRRLLATTSGNLHERVLAHNLFRRQVRTAFIQGIVALALATPAADLPRDVDAVAGSCWELAFSLCREVFPDAWNQEDVISSIREVHRRFGAQPHVVETRAQQVAQLPDVLKRSLILNPPGVA